MNILTGKHDGFTRHALVYSYVIIESTTGEFLFFLAIAGYVSFIGIFGFGVMTSIIIDVITKK
jgi:hypothetical protein